MMPALPTVEIHSTKDPSVKAIINASDFDPDIHTLWIEEVQDSPSEDTSAGPEPEVLPLEAADAIPNEDQVINRAGTTVAVYIVHPDDGRRRHQIAVHDFDPETHTPWSMRGH